MAPRIATRFADLDQIIPHDSDLVYAFMIPNVVPGARTALELIGAAIAQRRVTIQVRSTAYNDYLNRPFEEGLAKYREVSASDSDTCSAVAALSNASGSITLADTRRDDSAAAQIIMRRLMTVPSGVLGTCRVCPRIPIEQALTPWFLRIELVDQRNSFSTASHNVRVSWHKGVIQMLGSNAHWPAIERRLSS